MVITVGLPVYFLELSFGQFASLGVTKIWRIGSFWKGIGVAMCIVSLITCTYYTVIVAYTVYYLFRSFTAKLPWDSCDNSWNTKYCLHHANNLSAIYNASLFDDFPLCGDHLNRSSAHGGGGGDAVGFNHSSTHRVEHLNCTRTSQFRSPTLEFWENHVLGLSSGIYELGTPQIHIVISLLVAWVLVCLSLIKGIQSTGKVVYFTATFPYVILTILLVRGVTLPGAFRGLLFLITPSWRSLREARVWSAAANQVFYSLGVGFGGLMTMASYNKFRNNCHRAAIIVSLVDTFTSLYGGLVIFSILGFMAQERGVHVSEVASSGAGLAFIAYPEAVARMPHVPPLWSCLFFAMLIILGIDTLFTTLETVITAIVDEMPHMRPYKLLLTVLFCVVQFAAAMPLTCNGGQYILTLIDEYAAGFSLLFIALFELLVIVGIYGIRRFSLDIKCMLGFQPTLFWKVCWLFVSPAMITFVIIFTCVQYHPPTYGEYHYPLIGPVLGWLSMAVSVVFIPIGMVVQFVRKYDGGCLKTLRAVNRPTDDWGPANADDRARRASMGKSGAAPTASGSSESETHSGTDNPAFIEMPLESTPKEASSVL